MFSWYKYLIVNLVFSHLGFWSGNLFLIAPFPDLCLLVLFKDKERESKQSARTNHVFKGKETVYQLESKQSARKDLCSKRKKIKAFCKKNPVFKAKETVYQLESKQIARENQAFRAQERVLYQNASKRKARENPCVLECERIRKQQVRQENRKFNDNSGENVPSKRCKHDTDTLSKHCQKISLWKHLNMHNMFFNTADFECIIASITLAIHKIVHFEYL